MAVHRKGHINRLSVNLKYFLFTSKLSPDLANEWMYSHIIDFDRNKQEREKSILPHSTTTVTVIGLETCCSVEGRKEPISSRYSLHLSISKLSSSRIPTRRIQMITQTWTLPSASCELHVFPGGKLSALQLNVSQSPETSEQHRSQTPVQWCGLDVYLYKDDTNQA